MAQRYQEVLTCVTSIENIRPLGRPFDRSTLSDCLNRANESESLNVGWGNLTSQEINSQTIGSCYFTNFDVWDYTPNQRCSNDKGTASSITVYRRLLNDVENLTPLTPTAFETIQPFGTQWAWGIRFILATDGTNIFYTDPVTTPKYFLWKLVPSGNKFLLQSNTQGFVSLVNNINSNETDVEIQLTHDKTNSRVVKWDLTESGEFSTTINGKKWVLTSTTPPGVTFPPTNVVLTNSVDPRNLIIYSAIKSPFDDDIKDLKIADEIIVTAIIFIIAVIIIIGFILFLDKRSRRR